MANTFVKIQTVTVGSGGAASIAFTSIPQTYTDLLIKLSTRAVSGAALAYTTRMKMNNLTSSIYSQRAIEGNGATVISFAQSGIDTDVRVSLINGPGSTSSVFGSSEIYIPNYTSSNSKSVSIESFTENSGTTIYSNISAYIVASSNAITDLTFTNEVSGGNFAQYSTATLYGIKSS